MQRRGKGEEREVSLSSSFPSLFNLVLIKSKVNFSASIGFDFQDEKRITFITGKSHKERGGREGEEKRQRDAESAHTTF